MGNNNQKNVEPVKKEIKEDNILLSKNHFDFLYVIGRGGFGKVWKVTYKKYKKSYALKEMSKAKIIDKKSERSIRYEKQLLSKINHPFIVNMIYAFQDTENLYLVMDLLTGGDLRYHISRYKKFNEEQTKFFVCCILLGLDFLHTNNMIHRDIKPENLVLDERGYVRITDFGIAKLHQKENSSETSGTPGYMAPEVMCAQNHTTAVDYFALGVFTYEFMFGIRPYMGKSRKEIKDKIMAKQVQIKRNEIPDGWSTEAADFTNRLLQRKPANRLGLRGAHELREHAWLKYYPWKDLYEKKIDPPFVPKIGDNFDAKYCNTPENIGNNTKEKYEQYLRDENLKDLFKDFHYYFNDLDLNDKNNFSDKKFYNPHLQIQSNSLKSSMVRSNTSQPPLQSHLYRDSSSTNINLNNTKLVQDKTNIMNNIDTRFSKIKLMSSSGSTNSLVKHYRMSSSNILSSNSTSNSTNSLLKRSGSSANLNY